MSSKCSISFYYGHNNLAKLRQFEKLVLQPDHYSKKEIAILNKHSETYAYISLGEDTDSDGPWKLERQNPDWGGFYVDMSSELWHKRVLEQVEAYFEKGFQALFLDTLDAIDVYPEHRDGLLSLLDDIRLAAKGKSIMANRGFSLMPELKNYVDSIVFEGFSCVWTADGVSRTLTKPELLWTKRIAKELKASGLTVYALDYAHDNDLREFANKRAKEFGFISVTSNRNLTLI